MNKKDNVILFTRISGLIGVIVFLIIYGFEVLDVTKDGWLINTGDLNQHYMGWVFYRKSSWTFPIGLFNTLSYPNYASIIYTDSIPLFAVIFKMLSGILPDTFQYFGIYGIMCYILQGIFSYTLIRKFVNNKLYTIVGTFFFIISPYMLEKMYGHTSLASNFLILAALCIWAYRHKLTQKKKIISWIGIISLSTTIHLYYVPMILIIMIAASIAEYKEDKKSLKYSALTFALSLIATYIFIYILGGGSGYNYSYPGANIYNANLNTFLNPQGFSAILPNLDKATTGEYEAFGYLGCGIILMAIISSIIIIKNNNRKDIVNLIKNPNTIFLVICFLLSFVISIGTSIKFGNKVIFEIPYPKIILYLFGIFRATGRFIWLPSYLIFFTCIYTIFKYESKKIANTIIIICLLIQIIDFYPRMNNKFSYTERKYEYDNYMWEQALKDCNHILCIHFSNGDSYDLFKIAYLAKEYNCTMSNFYFAREIENIKETQTEYIKELVSGKLEDGYVYILKEKDTLLLNKIRVKYYLIDGYCVFTNKQLNILE